MKDTVTLELTRAVALALDELVNSSAERFFMVVGGNNEDYTFDGWKENDAADACDKVRAAVLGQPSSGSWRVSLEMRLRMMTANADNPLKPEADREANRRAQDVRIQATKHALAGWVSANARPGTHGAVTLALLELGIERHLEISPDEKSARDFVGGVLRKVLERQRAQVSEGDE